MNKQSQVSLSGLHRAHPLPYRHLVRDHLRDAILTGQLKPGQHLNEEAVAERLGVSSTPVREAFRELEHAGLIVVKPHRGAVVSSLSHRDLAEMYSLRAHLERLAIRLAHPRLTDEDFAQLGELIRQMEEAARGGDAAAMVEIDVSFHRLIVSRANHSLLLRMWEQIHPSQWTYVTVRVLSEKGPLYIARRHWPLLEVLRGNSVEAAEAAAADHIDTIGVEALEVFDSMRPAESERSEKDMA